ncbi:MAG: putative Ig domain-containing protein [Limisphaerales bacterium]
MKISFLKVGLRLALFQLSWLACQTGMAAVGFNLTPSAISNTYNGTITLQVTGLTNTETVVVQKFLDLNTNGAIDASDLLVQQFNLTDGQAGMVIGGVTNINVPGDTDGAANAQITATLNFQNGDFVQNIIGKYLFKLSSPSGHFSPQTKSFSVTNFPYAQKITGVVTNNGVAVPNAVVLLFGPPKPGDHGPGNPVAAAVVNNSGSYTIQAPVGSYMPLAFKSNYVANFGTSPQVTLGSGQTISTNLALTTATESISGRLVDENSGAGIPGIFDGNNSQNGFIGTTFTDTNGYFTERVLPDNWQLNGQPPGLILHGYVGDNNGTNIDATGGSVSGLTLGFQKATALFYGTVKDNLGNPLTGIDINASDDDNNNNGNSTYSADGYSDANGNYVVGVVGGLGNNDPWQVQAANDSNPTNYLFSQPTFDQNGGTNLNIGAAVHQNFTALLATNHITGHVQFNGTNVVGVGVNANATIGGITYQPNTAHTDDSGNYSLNVANGDPAFGYSWLVNLNCNGGDDSLDNILGSGNYQCPDSQYIYINNNNGTANFTVQSCNGVQISTTSLPDGTNGVYYYQSLGASSCSGNITWSINSGSLPSNFTLDQVGELFGTPNSSGTYNFTVHADDGNGHTADQPLSLYIAPAAPGLQITTTSLPNGSEGVYYSQTLQASGGQTPYTWSLNGNTPFGLTLSSDGILSGTPNSDGTNTFTVFVTDSNGDSTFTNLTLAVNPAPGPLQITTTFLPNGTNGDFYTFTFQASGGTPPYSWSIPDYSAGLPPNLTLSANGVLSGTPSTSVGYYYFDVVVTDAVANTVEEDGIALSIVNPPPPPLTITNVSLPDGNVGVAYSAQLGATGGQPPYNWQIAAGSANPPPGLSLNSSGLISGTPTTNKVSSFKVQVTDSSVYFATTNKVFSITINPAMPLTISSPAHFSGGQFQMTVSGTTGLNYTVQMTTNLNSAWIPVLTTNPSSGSFLFNDANATNQQRFYRVIGQ